MRTAKTEILDYQGALFGVVTAVGDNLDFVKQWTDLVDIEVQVGDTMQRIVGKAVSTVEVNGLEKNCKLFG